jgi:hypothetical protein
MKWKQSGNIVETQWKQSGLKWKQKNVSSCFQLFPVYVSSGNVLITGLLRLCFHCFHFFKRASRKKYIYAFKFVLSSTSGNYKSLVKQDFKENPPKTDFKAFFLYLTGLLWTNNKSLKFDTFPGMLKLTPVKLDAILRP